MAKRVFEADLSVAGIQKLKNDLLNYKNNEFNNQCTLFVNRLAEKGLEVALESVNSSPVGKYVTIKIDPATPGKLNAKIIGSGVVNQEKGREPFYVMLAVEYGSGIRYNEPGNPDAEKMGFGPGTFPGQVHAFDEGGWYYYDAENEKWKHTYGIKATMPMYNAMQMIKQVVENTAKEVFG